MPMHLNSLTPMRISGTPRSFLNLDNRCPTSIEAVVIGGDLDSPLPTLRVGWVSMNMLSSLSVVARILPASEESMRLGGLETSLHPNLLDPPQPAEAPGAFEERGRQALARLMASAAMKGKGGPRYRSRVPYNQRLLPLPLPMDNGAATSEARSPAPGSGAICAIGTDGHRVTNWFTDSVAGRGFDNQGSDPASPFRSQDPLHRPC
jgi:hypothetical protein